MFRAFFYALLVTSPLLVVFALYTLHAFEGHWPNERVLGLLMFTAYTGWWFGSQMVWFGWRQSRHEEEQGSVRLWRQD